MTETRRKFVAAAASAFAGIAVVRAPARAATFALKCASGQPVDHPSSVRLRQMWQTIERESGGRISAQYFPASQLGNDAAMFTQLRTGAIDFNYISPGNLAAVVPIANIGFLGFGFKDATEALHVMDGPLGGYVRSEITAKGIHPMGAIWDGGMVHTSSSSHPIRTPDDLRGFKIRVTESKIVVDLFKGLGATPAPLSLNEVYTALQTKLVDGASSTLASIESARLFEVQKYISLTAHAWSGNWLIANADSWKALPPDLQALIERNNTKYSGLERRDFKIGDASLADRLGRQGVTVNTVDQTPFRAHLTPYFDYWANAFGATAWGLLQTSLGRKLG